MVSEIERTTCGGVVMSGKTNLSSLQMSRRQGICVTPALMKKAARQPSMPYLSVLSPLRTHNSLALLLRRFFCLEDSKRLVRRDHISNISERGRLHQLLLQNKEWWGTSVIQHRAVRDVPGSCRRGASRAASGETWRTNPRERCPQRQSRCE